MKLKEIILEAYELPKDVVKAFNDLARQQRGLPEIQMVKVQKTSGGNVLDVVIEHTGDLIHRMTEPYSTSSDSPDMGQDDIQDKTQKVLRTLTRENDGFVKEMEQGFFGVAEHRNISLEDLKKRTFAELKKYGEEHAKLPAYNNVQVMAREACTAISELNFDQAIADLRRLNDLSYERHTWLEESTKFTKNEDGTLKRF